MNNIPLIPGNNPGRKNILSKKPTRLAIILSLVVIAVSSTLYWARGADERNNTPDHSQSKLADTLAKPVVKGKELADSSTKNAVAGTLDTTLYNQHIAHLTNGDSSGHWPVQSIYPNAGALLPFKRIIAFYGNLYSKRMGILGELPPDEMLKKLQGEVKKWQLADSTIEVIPALHYIATTAQMSPGNGGKYRLRMPFNQIDSVLNMAKQINALVFLDLQVGLSTLEEEIPMLEKYLMMPNVHLGIDPEFSMKTGVAPGKVVGTFDATDVNYASNYLADLVKKNNLSPKILVIHRFTKAC